MKDKFFLIIILLLLASCENQAKKDQEMESKTQKVIFQIHDSLMASMDKLMNLQEKLKKHNLKADFKITGKAPDSLILSQKMEHAYLALDSSNQQMMNWMNAFKPDYKGKDHASTMNYLETELAKLKKIDSLTKTSMKAADSLVNHEK